MIHPLRSGLARALLAFSILFCGALAQGQEIGAGNILTVGPGKTYALPSEAIRAANPGDTVRIFPGTYADCARLNWDRLVVEGVGGEVVITGKVCDDKAFFIVRASSITVRGITFLSARSSSYNGAGIHVEGADLTVENSRFLDNEDGILAADNLSSTILIRNSTFKGNGSCTGPCAHGIYVGHIARLRVENSEFSEQHIGHHIKSRAEVTEVLNNSVQDGAGGSSSYLVDLPNGGSAVIAGNIFEKGPHSQNKQVAISVGAERSKIQNPAGLIRVEDNIFSNNTGGATVFVKNYSGRSTVSLTGNRFAGEVTPLEIADAPSIAVKAPPQQR
ncbi:MAG TPA: right-handed parallel beta-helix repeat-containing protein [Rhizomicrobium sp.]|nr:right-handed parallel beta-helix repeat-containing protein [Rhizomicrobium sp.]